MRDRILIDTSIWIDYFRTPKTPLTDEISSLLRNGRICYADIVALELIRGAKTRKELSILDVLFSTIHRLIPCEKTFREAGLLGYHLARKGATLGTVDLLIAQFSIENDVQLYTRDQHFQTIAGMAPLKLYRGVIF